MKTPTPSEETKNQGNQVETEETASQPASKTRAGARKFRQNKTLYRKGKNSYDEFV